MNKAVFLDRDGVINEKAPEHEYILSWKDFKFFPDTLSAVSQLSKTDYKLFIITNQRGIAKGKISQKGLEKIHEKMLKQINVFGGRIDKIYFCPHDNNQCNCRKPLPGMLDNAKKENNLCLEKSWVVGDSLSDISLGRSRGCKTIYIGKNQEAIGLANYSANCLNDAVNLILSNP